MFLHTLECPFTVVSASITIVPCLLFLATSTLCQTFRDIGPGLLLLDSQMKSSEHYIHKSNSNRFELILKMFIHLRYVRDATSQIVSELQVSIDEVQREEVSCICFILCSIQNYA